MDDLLNHCIRELGFDGDLGCSASRLREFVQSFYEQNPSAHQQCLDDDFMSFVWSMIVEHSNVRVGTVPPDLTSEVYIAPQTSAARKAKAKGIEYVEATAPELCLVEDAKDKPLYELQEEHGDKLRIALTPDAVFEAITGSHIRSSKLSPMVYSVLQIVTRGREAGVAVVDLGQVSGYDPKTCFYLVKQLVELDLIVKVRRGGVGTHLCLHRYYFDRDPSWRNIREEEALAESHSATKEENIEDKDSAASECAASGFTPIDARHLSSLPLVRGRVVKLLKTSPGYMHRSNNMLLALGFLNPSKTDRRFFQTRMRDLVAQGVVERVLVQGKKNPGATTVKCYRLVTDECSDVDGGDIVVRSNSMDEDEEPRGVKSNISIQKQLHDLLEESGQKGCTVTELADSLNGFDRRSVELLLTRADKNPPPSHLRDLGILSLMETYGRERRYRYMTAASYHELVSKDSTLDVRSSTYAQDVNLNVVGGFAELDPKLFVKGKSTSAKAPKSANSSPGKGANDPPHVNDEPVTPRKSAKRKSVALGTTEGDESPNKRVRTQEVPPTVTPTPKRRGRPPKNKVVENAVETPTPKKRGRPRKHPIKDQEQITGDADPNQETPTAGTSSAALAKEARKRKPSATEGQGRVTRASNKRPRVVEEEDQEPSPANMGTEQDPTDNTQPAHAIVSDLSGQPSPQTEGGDKTTHANVAGPSSTLIPDALSSLPSASVSATHANLPSTTQQGHRKDTRPSTASTSKVDISRMRRENEILRVLENMGGITNVNWKEFYDAHAALVENMNQAGEQTSILPSMRLDKRTAQSAISNMQDAGRVKVIKTTITIPTGGTRAACIAYLPTVAETKVQEFMANLEKNVPGAVPGNTRVMDIVGCPAPPSLKKSRDVLLHQVMSDDQSGTPSLEGWTKDLVQAEQLFQQDDDIIRQLLLTEPSTVGQSYGFLTSKVLRCRFLHLLATEAFEREETSPHIASKEKRIAHLSFFFNDITLESYCTIWSSLVYDDHITAQLSTEEGRKTLLKDVSPAISTLLQIGRARSRSRLLDMLLNLHSLGIVTPLEPSDAESDIQCSDTNGHPSLYKSASLDGWTSDTPQNAPQYWQLHTSIPVFLLVLTEGRPPFWKMAPASSSPEVIQYWEDLQMASLRPPHSDFTPAVSEDNPACQVPAVFLKHLRRSPMWSAEYSMTWRQKQYLQWAIKTHDQEHDVDLERLSWISNVPKETISNFVAKAREQATSLSKGRRRRRAARDGEPTSAQLERNRVQNERSRLEQEAKALLAQRAAEAREHRENEWKELIARVHPEPLSGVAAKSVARVQDRFVDLVVNKDPAEWENEIRVAIAAAETADKNVLKRSKRKTNPPATTVRPVPIPPAPAVVNARERSVRSLIDQQEKLIEAMPRPPAPMKKRSRKKPKKDEEQDEPSQPKTRARRARFQWNWDFEELARDASVIIRSRCRSLTRLEFGALDQVFPSLPRNTVRQRLVHIRQAPGNETYLSRLEERWHEIWLQYRGTEHLKDDDIKSPSNFDLASHIEFLRKHIDKNALRVGFLERQEDTDLVIPSNVEDLMAAYTVQDCTPPTAQWDFVWNVTKEEGREQALLVHPFTLQLDDHLCGAEEEQEGFSSVAEAALKMVMGTDGDVYDAEAASSLLKSVGDEAVSAAAFHLLSKGVLSKLNKESRRGPGRLLRISESNANALGGTISSEIFQDASALEYSSAQQQGVWREWSLLSSEGDIVALSHLASEGKIDFEIDTTHAQSRRATIDWNSKKADDDDIETSIQVMFHDLSLADEACPMVVEPSSTQVEDLAASDVSMEHGKALNNKPGSCALVNGGVFDCDACLHTSIARLQSVAKDDFEPALRILAAVQCMGVDGLAKERLLESTLLPYEQANRVLLLLSTLDAPLLYICGNDSVVVVSASFISQWSVVVSQEPLVRVLPRRWLDIFGSTIAGIWEAAIRAVIGVVVFRPGVAQSELRWRLRSVYDRHEINDVLGHLFDKKVLRRVTALPIHPSLVPDDVEEKEIMWFLSEERRWYNL